MPDREINPLTRRDLLNLASPPAWRAPSRRAAGASPQAGGAGGGAPHVDLPPLSAPTEQKQPGPPNPMPPDDRVGYAVVGLGRIALEEVIPGFVQSKHSKVTALVSGHPDKAAAVARQYGIDPRNIYDYKNYEELRNNPAVQAVYIVLPNSMHAEYTVRAAQAGKHVFCEKPMATTSRDCQRMIDACRTADRKLMIGYRMQYEPYNREVIRRARAKDLGDLKFITADNGQNQGDPTQWRLQRALSGGGSLPDVGIYCLNAARYVTGEEPVEVFARMWSTPGDPRFKEVEETMVFELRFPTGVLASCTCGYGNHRLQRYSVVGSQGWAELSPPSPIAASACAWPTRTARWSRSRRCSSTSRTSSPARSITSRSCVTADRTPHTPGEEGLADVRIIEQLYASARAGHAMQLPPVQGLDSTRGPAPDDEG